MTPTGRAANDDWAEHDCGCLVETAGRGRRPCPDHKVMAPWPFYRQKAAAELLGVSVELLRGVANTPELRAVKVQGRSGADVYLFNRDDVKAMALRLKGRAAPSRS